MLLLIFLLTAIFIPAPLITASVRCTTNSDCESKLITPGVSICEDGKCTNPFERGCLQTMADAYGMKKDFRIPGVFNRTRLCNSDDEISERTKQWCRKPDFFAYDEVRIAPSNWESAVLLSWVYQILLTEVLEVPATMEHGDGIRGKGSFYDRDNAFVFPASAFEKIIHTTLWKSDELDGDCSKSIEPCAHILPDVWSSGTASEYLGTYMNSKLLLKTNHQLCL